MKYEYNTVTGTVAIDVDEKWFGVLTEFDRKERNNNHTETRRHSTLDNGKGDGEWLAYEEKEFSGLIPENDDIERVKKTLKMLKPEQTEILLAIYVEGKKQQEYAKEKGINQSNVSRRLLTAEKNFKNIFSKTA